MASCSLQLSFPVALSLVMFGKRLSYAVIRTCSAACEFFWYSLLHLRAAYGVLYMCYIMCYENRRSIKVLILNGNLGNFLLDGV